jgi:hypothetical protein
MTCQELAKRIEKLQPEALPRVVARLCLLLSNSVDDIDELKDEERLRQVWEDMMVRLRAVTEQYEAMTAELEKLSGIKSRKLTVNQILVLIRAIKVQSRVVQLYMGQTAAKTSREK